MSARRKLSALFPCFASPEAAAEKATDAPRHHRRKRLSGLSSLDMIFRPIRFYSTAKKGKSKRKEAIRSLAPEEVESSARSVREAVLSSESSLSSSSVSSSSSCLSSLSFTGAPTPIRAPRKPPPRAAAAKYGTTATGVLVLLVSLSVIVFCGRFCAILLTSSSLCFVPRRSMKPERREGRTAAAEPPAGWRKRAGKEEEEKRRVVMQGILDRNRNS